MAMLTKTPSGESLEKVHKLMRAMEGNPKMRRAVKAAIKAMGLPKPMPQDDSLENQRKRLQTTL